MAFTPQDFRFRSVDLNARWEQSCCRGQREQLPPVYARMPPLREKEMHE